MLRWCWLVTLAACGFRSPSGSDAAADPDGPSDTDAPGDASSELCSGAFVEVCLVALPTEPIIVNDGQTLTIDTQAGSSACAATMPAVDACVVSATAITVNGAIRGTGMRPLVLLARGSIQINSGGAIDVASRRGGTGAGANASRCVNGAQPTALTGGWGGSNASKGGDGNQAGVGSTGGQASAALPQPTALFGGCRGSRGAGTNAGNGGDGGGAVDLIAMAITIDGTINASGAGADGATSNGAGGGGGGSGGLIVLDAPNVTINGTARVFAQGGGGGEGATGGSAGGDGLGPTMPGQAGPGGSGGGSGGDGGDGATTGGGGNGGNDSGALDDGGGGGGGGAGFIKTTDPTPPSLPTSQVCPAFS